MSSIRNFISIEDYSTSELKVLLSKARDLKAGVKKNSFPQLLANKSLAMIFEKPSNRTRVSFEVGMFQLGGHALNLEPSGIQLGGRESIADVARTLSRFVQGVMLRTFSHNTVLEFAKYADVPIINGLTDYNHPCQAMADIMTLFECKGEKEDLVLTYVGDGNNVLHSLINICAKLGVKLRAGCPAGYMPDMGLVAKAREIAGDDIVNLYEDPYEAVIGADAVYTDVWASMGQEEESDERKSIFSSYQVNNELMSKAKQDAIVMHCLPAHRGDEITDEVVDGKQSVVFDQAENRLHAQKAVLVSLLLGQL